LYFHTASDAAGQSGHMIGMLVHGLASVDFAKLFNESLTWLLCWQREFCRSICIPTFLPCPFFSRTEQSNPGAKQKPQGFATLFRALSCRMCIPICETSSDGLDLESRSEGQRGQRCWSRISPRVLPSSSQMKQTAPKQRMRTWSNK
jgi:hypothetical protein